MKDIIEQLLGAVKADAPIQRAIVVSAAAEIERLREAIRRLADQDATLSVCDGNVTVQEPAKKNCDDATAADCACQNWGREPHYTPTNNGHHPSCSLATFDAGQLIASLVGGIRRWAADEDDTVHPACIAAYWQAKQFLRTHDAAPAATASVESVGTDKAEPLHGLGTGDPQEPVAWAVISDEIASPVISAEESSAVRLAGTCGGRVVPLHPLLRLTDAEREAIEYAEGGTSNCDDAATLRGLLERTK